MKPANVGLLLLTSWMSISSTFAGSFGIPGLADYFGNGITSTPSGSKQPLDIGIAVSGVIVDPRTRTWNLSSSDVPACTESGTWNVGLNAGSNLVGKVGIDQTTPGTTNGVQVNAALPAGSNIIGNVRVDQTTPGTTNGVVVNSGSITANAGANLNTSSLNLETTQSAFKTANHTDLIATQPRNVAQVNGVTVSTGTGASDTGTQRVTLAADGQKTMANSTSVTLSSDQAGINTFQDKSGTGTIIATNGTVIATTNGASSVVFNFTGTWSDLIVIEGVVNSVAIPLNFIVLGTNVTEFFIGSNQAVAVPTGGFSQVQARSANHTSGTVNVAWSSGSGNNAVGVFGQVVQVDTSGNVQPTGDTVGRAIFHKITDGTTTATVKAASTSPAVTDTALVVTQRPDNVGTPTQTSVSCAGTTTTLLAAGAATMFVSVKNPTTSTVTIWINVAGSSAVAAAPSMDLPPGAEAYFSSQGESYLPTSQMNCISSGGASSVALTYK